MTKENIQKLIQQKIGKTDGTIIHNDIDGILSGIYFYHATGHKIQGIFTLNSKLDMYSQLFAEDRKLINKIFLDCAIMNNEILTIDHHYTKLKAWGSNNINCNKYNVRSKDIDVYGSFLHKNPTGNILWIMYLLGEDVSRYTYEQQLLLLMADSFYLNYHNTKYKQNCRDWLKLFKMECLIDTLENPKMFSDMSKLKQEIGFFNKGFQIWDTNSQQFISNGANKTTQQVINNIVNLMGWKECQLPSIFYCHNFINQKLPANDIDNIMKEKLNFTSAIREISKNPTMYVSKYIETIENTVQK